VEYGREHIIHNGTYKRSTARRDPICMDRSLPSCYGCGWPGVIKAKCRKCNSTVQVDSTQPPNLN
ncbi:hypothetical protein CEXT_131551, partial [Caerostris extrusa]